VFSVVHSTFNIAHLRSFAPWHFHLNSIHLLGIPSSASRATFLLFTVGSKVRLTLKGDFRQNYPVWPKPRRRSNKNRLVYLILSNPITRLQVSAAWYLLTTNEQRLYVYICLSEQKMEFSLYWAHKNFEQLKQIMTDIHKAVSFTWVAMHIYDIIK